MGKGWDTRLRSPGTPCTHNPGPPHLRRQHQHLVDPLLLLPHLVHLAVDRRQLSVQAGVAQAAPPQHLAQRRVGLEQFLLLAQVQLQRGLGRRVGFCKTRSGKACAQCFASTHVPRTQNFGACTQAGALAFISMSTSCRSNHRSFLALSTGRRKYCCCCSSPGVGEGAGGRGVLPTAAAAAATNPSLAGACTACCSCCLSLQIGIR